MTGQNLVDASRSFTSVGLGSDQVLAWCNMCQADIAADLGKVVRHTFTNVSANVGVALPTDFVSLCGVLVSDLPYKKTHRVQITPDKYIQFPDDLASVTILYRRVPPMLTTLSEELEVERLIQPHILLYLIGMYYDQEGEGDAEESGMANRYLSMWERKKNEIIAKIYNPTGSDPVATDDEMPRRGYRHYEEDEEDG